MPNQGVNPDQCRAHSALQELLALGLTQKDVACELDIHHTIVSHINTIYLRPDYHVAPRHADALEALVGTTRQAKARSMLEGWPLVVLETCNSEGAAVDDNVRASIREAILAGLSAGSGPAPSFKFDLPPDIAGALARLGPDAWVFVRSRQVAADGRGISGSRVRQQIDVLEAEIRKAQVAIHEMKHLINALEAESTEQRPSRMPKAAY
jgi:hypothetical protein